jgi:hypothetical protein
MFKSIILKFLFGFYRKWSAREIGQN